MTSATALTSKLPQPKSGAPVDFSANGCAPSGGDDESIANASILDTVQFAKFQPSKQFSQVNASILGAVATASYSKSDHQKMFLNKQSAVKDFEFLDSADNQALGIPVPDTDTQVSLVQTKNALLVAARGTTPPWESENSNDQEWGDFESDFVAVPVPNYDGSGKIHKGFKDAADGIWDQLKPHLQSAIATHKAIHFSGHSLGAAVALLLADRMAIELHQLPATVTRYGGPDVGWEDQKTHLETIGLASRTYNLENCTDPVPGLLPQGVEAGHDVYFDRHGICDIDEHDHSWDKTVGAAQDVYHGHPDPTHRHHPEAYMKAISLPENISTFKRLENM